MIGNMIDAQGGRSAPGAHEAVLWVVSEQLKQGLYLHSRLEPGGGAEGWGEVGSNLSVLSRRVISVAVMFWKE